MRGKNPAAIAGMILLGIIAIVGLAILFGFVIMWLWNWLMPELFDLPTIGYWQAVGLFILFKILIGGCGGRGSGSKHKGNHGNCSSNNKNKSDFSKWKHYDKFWKEEGDKAYERYVEERNGGKSEEPSNEKSEDKNEEA